MTKQAAESALVRANRERQMKSSTLKNGSTSATDEKNEMKMRTSLANPLSGGRAAIAIGPDEEQGRGIRHPVGEASHLLDVPRTGGVDNRARGEEEEALEQRMVQGMEERTEEADQGEGGGCIR